VGLAEAVIAHEQEAPLETFVQKILEVAAAKVRR
jgi:hypothetical protein